MVSLESLSAGYGGADILHQINLTIPKGDFLAIVGPNGCGKSTLLKTIAGLNPHYTGSITILGKSLDRWPRMALSRVVALLPQCRDVPMMDVETLVAHGRFPQTGFLHRLTALDHDRIHAAMQNMGILHLRNTSVRELSGGEQQKAYLAMMLAQDTDLLLLDEPTTYLDAGCQLDILNDLIRLNQQGKTIVMVLHDLNHAFSYTKRIGLIARGELLSVDTPANLVANRLVDQIFSVETTVFSKNEQAHYVFSKPGNGGRSPR